MNYIQYICLYSDVLIETEVLYSYNSDVNKVASSKRAMSWLPVAA